MTPELVRDLRRLFADAYHAAAMEGADMCALAETLEPVFRAQTEKNDTLLTRTALDKAAGGNTDPLAEAPLIQLRDQFVTWQKKYWIHTLEQTLAQSADAAWTLFLRRYAEALSHWRTRLSWWWADTAAGETPDNKSAWFPDKTEEIQRIRENSRLIEQARWPEAYPFLLDLSANPLLIPPLRSHLRTVCGSIQMYYNTLPDAENDLAAAEKLYPELPYLTVCRSDLARIKGNYPEARSILDPLLAARPNDVEVLIACGRSFMEEKKYEEAAALFEKALRADPGNASCYRNIVTLWSKDETSFAQHRGQIPHMIQMADRADPESDISNRLDAAYAFQNAGDFDAALEWFGKALDLEPERPETLTALGYLHQLQKAYDPASELYQRVVQLAPGATDGYWNMAGLCSEQGQYEEAAAWFARAIPHCPMFTRTLQVKAAEMYIAAGNPGKGRDICLEALRSDPQFDFAINTLHDLADRLRNQSYDEKTGPEAALETLRLIRQIKGDSYEGSFQNRSGNVYYYFADYPNAATCYRKAIAADASEPVYHDNLAGALEKLTDKEPGVALFEEAVLAAQAAARLKPGENAYMLQVGRLERKLVSLRHFGVLPDERSADFAQVRVRFRDDLYPFLVKNDALAPELLQGIEAMREKFRTTYGLTIPGVRFSTDWNISHDANYVLDLDGIPLQQGWFDTAAPTDSLNSLLEIIEQHFQYGLADFIHYDSAEISAKFVGRPAAYAAGFFQVIRVLLKQKISVADINTIHACYEAGTQAGKTIQAIVGDIRRHPSIKPTLPVNTAGVPPHRYLTPEQEKSILSHTGKSNSGQLLWEIRANDPVFYEVLAFLPHEDGGSAPAGPFVITENAATAAVLNDLHPTTFFCREELAGE
jgi:tetratricopeptide (TPR) repeat protein